MNRVISKEMIDHLSFGKTFIHQSNEGYKLQFLRCRHRLHYFLLRYGIDRRIGNNVFCFEQWLR